jgi:hypothetical protein
MPFHRKLFIRRLTHQLLRHRFYLALAFILILAISASTFLIIKLARSPRPLAFHQSLFEASTYTATIPGIDMTTSLTANKDNASVVVGRADSTLTFTIPLTNSQITGSGNTVAYSAPKNGLKLDYQLTPRGLKESIVLGSAPAKDATHLPLTLSLKNLVVKLTPEGIPVFYDGSGTYQFNFEAPYAIDAKGAVSHGFSYRLVPTNQAPLVPLTKLTKHQDGTTSSIRTLVGTVQDTPSTASYTLELVLDSSWLSDKARTYPVTIDPTVVHNTSSTFATGTTNRTFDAGSGSSPNLTIYYQELPADESTVGLWHMNEANGVSVADSSGNGNTGTATGTTINTSTQALGTASRTFAGTTSDYINFGDLSQFNFTGASAFTAEAWINLTNDPTKTQYEIINKLSYTANKGWYFGVNYNSGSPYVFISMGSDTCVASAPAGSIGFNTWTHVAAVVNPGSKIALYINGKEPTYTTQSVTCTVISPAGSKLSIGYRPDTINNAFTFKGGIDEVRISNVARSADEIRMDASRRPYGVYTSPLVDFSVPTVSWNSLSWSQLGVNTGDGETISNSTGLIAQWNFNEVSGTTASVVSGSCSTSCNGTLTSFSNTTGQDVLGGSGWTAANGRWPSSNPAALMFNGTNNYVQTGTINYAPTTSSPFSVETWVKINAVPSEAVAIIQSADGTGTGQTLIGAYNGNSNFYTAIGGVVLYSTVPVTIGQWQHVAIVYSGTGETFYVNGIAAGSASNIVEANSAPFLFGVYKSLTSGYFSGIIDSTRIYSRALTASEILSNYQAGNLELQTRVGASADPNDGSWEVWKPTTSETAIDNMDNPLDYATPSASIVTGALVATSSASFPIVEGTHSLQIQTGKQTSMTSVVGMWHLDETGGTGAYLADSSGSGNNGTPTGTTVVDGVTGKARSFNGASDYITINSSTLSTGGTKTVEAWIKTSTTTGMVFSSYDGTNGYQLYVTPTGNLALWSNGGLFLNSGMSIIDGKWHYVVGTWDGTNGNLYLDGVMVMSAARTITTNTSNQAQIGVYCTGPCGTPTGYWFNGTIDEVRVSTVARSPEEIAESYRLGRDHYINKTIATTDLSGKTSLPFYVAADRPGTYLTATVGNNAYDNYQPDGNTVGLWHLDENNRDNNSILKFASTNVAATNAYTYWKAFSGGGQTVATGDTFEYDAYAATNVVNISGIDVRYSDGSYARSSTWTDQYGVLCYMGSTTYYAKWIHRVCTVPAAMNGKTISWIDAVNENDTATATVAYYDNMVLKNSAGAIKNTFYTSGASSLNVLDFNSNAGNTGAITSTTFAAEGIVWNDGQTTGNFIKDSSGNINNGSPTGTYSIQGKIGNARNFNGVNDAISVNDNASLQLSTPMTVESWFKTSTTPASNTCLVRKDSASGTRYLYGLLIDTAGKINAQYYNTTNNNLATSALPITDNNWHYAVNTISGTTMSLYLDGILQATTTIAGSQVSPNGEMDIGACPPYVGGGIRGQWFTGLIDEVRISNIARTAADIRAAYEIGSRTHEVTIDFAATLSSVDPITSPSDHSFIVDGTAYGLSSMADNLYLGDKIIVRENYNGTTYLAQGTVNSVNSATGSVTVTSWDAGSTFPSGGQPGFSGNATVFKWQREYFDLGGSLASQRNAITNLTLRVASGNEGRTIYLDDLRSAGSYLANPAGSTITSSNGFRYFQYRTIMTSSNYYVSPSLTSVTVDYVPNTPPTTPSLDLPTTGATNQILTPLLKTTTTDPNGDYLRYKIVLCTNLAMTTGCQTFDQTLSQTGWSGQNAQTGTAYNSGTQGVYTIQTALSPNTTYYWDSYAIDPGGSNTWGSTQGTPYSFTTNVNPGVPTLDTPFNNATSVLVYPVFKTTALLAVNDYLRYKIVLCTNLAMTTGCQTFDQTLSQTGWSGQNAQTGTAYASGTQAIYTAQTSLSAGNNYYWQSYAIDPAGTNVWSATQATPSTFSTLSAPNTATTCLVRETSDQSSLTVIWNDVSTNEDGYEVQRSVDGAAFSVLQTGLAPNTTSKLDNTVTSGHTYQYRVAPYFTAGPTYGTWCTTAKLSLMRGNFSLQNIKFQ